MCQLREKKRNKRYFIGKNAEDHLSIGEMGPMSLLGAGLPRIFNFQEMQHMNFHKAKLNKTSHACPLKGTKIKSSLGFTKFFFYSISI